MRINMNKLAKEVTLLEGKKVSINIGQVKEVIKITLKCLAKYNLLDVLKLIVRYRSK